MTTTTLTNCGTYAGYSRHKRRGETICEPCRGARREYENGRHSPAVRPPLKPCGTITAAKRHRKKGEKLCESCIQAERAYEEERRRAQGIAPKRTSNELIEEIEFLLQCGEGEHRILQAAGLTRQSLVRSLYQNGRGDLYTQIFDEKAGWVGN